MKAEYRRLERLCKLTPDLWDTDRRDRKRVCTRHAVWAYLRNRRGLTMQQVADATSGGSVAPVYGAVRAFNSGHEVVKEAFDLLDANEKLVRTLWGIGMIGRGSPMRDGMGPGERVFWPTVQPAEEGNEFRFDIDKGWIVEWDIERGFWQVHSDREGSMGVRRHLLYRSSEVVVMYYGRACEGMIDAIADEAAIAKAEGGD